jgi:two-component system, chemotaxis family, protein-glutamate methylesterase/glutaminase
VAERDIVVVGASAGGVESFLELVSKIPREFPGALFCVLHQGAKSPSRLANLLARKANIPVIEPLDCDLVRHGVIYVAPADRHLIFMDSRIRIVGGPKENMNRPSIDTTLRSAARVFGSRLIGVVLTGLLDDGANGLAIVKEHGGISIVQDPKDASFSSMPENAIESDSPDYIVPLADVPALLMKLCTGGPPTNGHNQRETKGDNPQSQNFKAVKHANFKAANPEAASPECTLEGTNRAPELENMKGQENASDLTCPECSGTLFHIRDEGGVEGYVCRVGHRYTLNTLQSDNHGAVERALWVAMRTLEESGTLSRRLAERARARGSSNTADMFEERAANREKEAELIRNVLLSSNSRETTEVE